MAFQHSNASSGSLPNGLPPPFAAAGAGSSAGSKSPFFHDAFPSIMSDATNFDIFEWHPAYQSCQRYFLDRAQHEGTVQAVSALINICLPSQWMQNPVVASSGYAPHATIPSTYPLPYARPSPVTSARAGSSPCVSLVPYVRRLVVTGFDNEGILHGFFGDDWRKGVGPIQECERRNYLFAAKSVGWAKVKYQYDISPHETVPFLRPLQKVQLAEIESAEKIWSYWLAFEDWMVGPRAPDAMEDSMLRDERGRPTL